MEQLTQADTDIPAWRRLTAFFTLGSITILIGIAVASIVSLAGLLFMFSVQGG